MTFLTRPNGPPVDLEDVVSAMHTFGYADVDAEMVVEYVRTGSLPESTVGPDYDDRREAALAEVLDELEIEVGS